MISRGFEGTSFAQLS